MQISGTGLRSNKPLFFASVRPAIKIITLGIDRLQRLKDSVGQTSINVKMSEHDSELRFVGLSETSLHILQY